MFVFDWSKIGRQFLREEKRMKIQGGKETANKLKGQRSRNLLFPEAHIHLNRFSSPLPKRIYCFLIIVSFPGVRQGEGCFSGKPNSRMLELFLYVGLSIATPI